MELRKIEEMTQILARIEKEIQETKESLHLIIKSIDKYDKYAFLNLS
ncbi:MAG: DegQ family regulator [Bacillota bacterium]